MAVREEWRSWRDGTYEVSSRGRVRRAKPGRRTWVGRILHPMLMKIGYYYSGPVINGRNVRMYVHAMVAECFLGPRPRGAEVNHRDGVKTNNVASNLEYITHAGNMAHARRTGLLSVGEDHVGAKLSNKQVARIRKRRMRGEGVCALAREYSVSPATVSEIVNMRRRIG